MNYEQILIRPVLSEKTNILRESGRYVFQVDMRANKPLIKEAVRVLFNVHPVACTTAIVGGKPKRQRYKRGYTSTWKKAVVTLAKDEKIPLFEGV
ncbi:MAG: 50S ribosomal protein L23 [Spirochaetaceae bacterium]|jgi:large subunit ribosomal protein L23|nr:50S ribosomal protein L23 [Spirochaetaceae bacterium]